MNKTLKYTTLLTAMILLAGCGSNNASSEVLPTSIELNETSKTIEAGDSFTLNATVLPDNAANKEITYTSSNEEVATVTADGLVSAISVGDADIVVTCVGAPLVSNTCTVTVVEPTIPVSSVRLSVEKTVLMSGETSKLVAVVNPNDATDKTVTWSSSNSDVLSVDNEGNVSANASGRATITVTTNSGNKSDSKNFTVYPSAIETFVTDTHNLISKVEESIANAGEYKEVEASVGYELAYNIHYGYDVRVTLARDGFIIPTGLYLDETFLKINEDNQVTFKAVLDNPSNLDDFYFDVNVAYKDTTPKVGEYEITTVDSENLTLVVHDQYENVITTADRNDTLYVEVIGVGEDYGVKSLFGTYTGYSSSKRLDFTYNSTVDRYTAVVPTCDSGNLKITVEEMKLNIFKGHPIVGDYFTTRTWGSFPSSIDNNTGFYIGQFTEKTLSVNANGEMDYSGVSNMTYIQSIEGNSADGYCGTFHNTYYYDSNLLVFGVYNMQYTYSPLEHDEDLVFAVKQKEGLKKDDYSFVSEIFRDGGSSYMCYTVYAKDELYISAFVDCGSKKIYSGVEYHMYRGENLADHEAVYDVIKDDAVIARVGYVEDGGYLKRQVLFNFKNGYTSEEHSLLFINNSQAYFDNELFAAEVSGNDLTLKAPLKTVSITLNSDMTFVVEKIEEIEPKELNIANKVFSGNMIDSLNNQKVATSITFGDSNTELTGTIKTKSSPYYYWKFTGEFNPITCEITITIIDRGYGDKTANIDNSIGKIARIYVEDGKITFLDEVSTQTNVYGFKNQVFTCRTFHF